MVCAERAVSREGVASVFDVVDVESEPALEVEEEEEPTRLIIAVHPSPISVDPSGRPRTARRWFSNWEAPGAMERV